MAAVEREPVALPHGVVPVALHFVDAAGDEARAVSVFFVVVVLRWSKGLLLLLAVWGKGGRGSGGEMSAFEMEAEKGVAEKVVECCPGAVPVVC